MNAKEARTIVAKNKERQNEIKKLIKRGEESIKWACEKGRRYSNIYAGYVESGIPRYPEVLDHFRNLGYEIEYCYGTNVYDVRW